MLIIQKTVCLNIGNGDDFTEFFCLGLKLIFCNLSGVKRIAYEASFHIKITKHRE